MRLGASDRDDPLSISIILLLFCLSKTSSMDTRVGIQNLISQVAMELLRRVVYIVVVGASTSAFHHGDGNKAQREYDTA